MKRRCASAAHLSSAAYVTRCDLQTASTQLIFILQGVCDTPVPPDALVDHSTREPVMYKRILTAALPGIKSAIQIPYPHHRPLA